MSAEAIVRLIEELVDLKVQQQAGMRPQVNPELARLLEEKRRTDRRRLESVRQELGRLLGQPVVKIVERK